MMGKSEDEERSRQSQGSSQQEQSAEPKMVWADEPERSTGQRKGSPKQSVDRPEPQIVWAQEPEKKAKVAKKVEANLTQEMDQHR